MSEEPILRKHIRLPQSWHWIERVRTMVSDLLTGVPAELRDAARIAASELAENVVKYGEPSENDECGEVIIEVDSGVVRIRATNGLASGERSDAVTTPMPRESADSAAAIASSYWRRSDVVLVARPTCSANPKRRRAKCDACSATSSSLRRRRSAEPRGDEAPRNVTP